MEPLHTELVQEGVAAGASRVGGHEYETTVGIRFPVIPWVLRKRSRRMKLLCAGRTLWLDGTTSVPLGLAKIRLGTTGSRTMG
jgi:hypothetical protein